MNPVFKDYLLVVGSYAKASNTGIYTVRYWSRSKHAVPSSYTLSVVVTTSGLENPSYLIKHPTKNRIFAASERLSHSGQVGEYAMEMQTGHMMFVQAQDVTKASPCYLAIDPSGRHLFSANYEGGSLSVFALHEHGGLARKTQEIAHQGNGPIIERQESAHPHAIAIDRQGKYALVTDLGTDEIITYEFHEVTESLSYVATHTTKPGAGPRLFIFHPLRSIGYAIHELNNTICVYDYDEATGMINEKQSVKTLPDDVTVKSTASHIAVSEDGRFLYASNRGHDSIVVYAIDETQGTLTPIQWISSGGKVPRHFAITPDGASLIVANQESDNISVLSIDPTTGKLTTTKAKLFVNKPTCVLVM
nr:lactonase family protein [Bacilli bacterium]